MRSIKLKRSTIESASKRLGTNKEGKKQLLKLILEWVEQYQLQKKRMTENGLQTDQNPNPNPNPNFGYNPVPPDPNTCFSTWMPSAPPPHAAPMAGYSADPYTNNPIPVVPMNHQVVVNGIPYHQQTVDYPVMEHAQSWPLIPMQQPQFSHFPDNGNVMAHQQAMYGNPYQMFDPNGERLMRLGSSATKEARKKRMARQRRLYSHHHRHSSNSNQHQNQMNDPHVVGDGGEEGDREGSPGNWVYWSAGGGSSSPTGGNVPPAESGDRAAMQTQNYQRLGSADRRQQQGWKTEKNLKFLLQKVLKQSDVGNLGRIVLPKMIRGVKVRQPGTKLEGKKPARRNMRNLSLAGNSSSLAPIKQAVR
ncbi:hypothetical protein DH2020_001168 [Rehmannia glutinosa]|uniref:Uncharacterized protein n=1 Tax=Rehmannia glutinosa TaxID=99300 RepID=A0ABR0XYW9_REHGL